MTKTNKGKERVDTSKKSSGKIAVCTEECKSAGENDDTTTMKTQLSEIGTDVPAVEKDVPAKGNFVIKRKYSDKSIDIVRKIEIEELRAEYPALEAVEHIKNWNSPLIYISEQAEKEIKEHIAWNKKTSVNIHEQGGLLIGKPLLVDKSFLGIVECIIPAEVSRASSVYLEMGSETWVKMLEIYDEKYKDKGLFIIGWFHTHPNSLPVFMSPTDMGTQRAFFNQDWQFSIVLNPHRRLIACFNSANADKCDFHPIDFVDK